MRYRKSGNLKAIVVDAKSIFGGYKAGLKIGNSFLTRKFAAQSLMVRKLNRVFLRFLTMNLG